MSAAGIHAHVVGAVAGSGAADESSDSEAEQEGPQKLIRKVSTSGQIRSKVRPPVLCSFSFRAGLGVVGITRCGVGVAC